jgi:hypothetical protein
MAGRQHRMKRPGNWIVLLFLLWLVLPGALRAESGKPARNSRSWQLGFQFVTANQENHKVFDRPGLPGADIDPEGHGGGLLFGYRFGERFVLGTQLTFAGQEVSERDWDLADFEALITATVLFREDHLIQPFLRGSFGGGGVILFLPGDEGNISSFGTVAGAGAGLNLQLSRGFSLELEAAAIFNNFLEVRNESDDPRFPDEESWQVRISRQGWRVGAGFNIWF